MQNPNEACWFCDRAVMPGESVMFMVLGWESPRVGGGANMIHLRERIGQVAHTRCVQDQKGKPVPTSEERALDAQARYRARVKRGD